MTMRRAWIDAAALASFDVGTRSPLPDDVAHRFARVLRLNDGAPIELFDGNGLGVRGRFVAPDAIDVDDRLALDDVLPPLVVAQALAKSDKLETVVQKATELGARELCLFVSHRCVVKLDDERGAKRTERLARVGADAARQCGRARAPVVDGPHRFATLLERVRAFAGVCVVGALHALESLSSCLRARDEALRAHGMLIVVGPEGGLDDGEVQALCDAGAHAVRLGAFVLRTETAGPAALAIAQAALGHA